MAEDKRIPVTVSDRAVGDIQLVAKYLGMPLAKLAGQQVDAWHQSPSFNNLLRRARAHSKAVVRLESIKEYISMSVPVKYRETLLEELRLFEEDFRLSRTNKE